MCVCEDDTIFASQSAKLPLIEIALEILIKKRGERMRTLIICVTVVAEAKQITHFIRDS